MRDPEESKVSEDRFSPAKVEPETSPPDSGIPCEKSKSASGKKSFLHEIVRTAVIAIVAAFLLRAMIIEPYRVTGDSMSPALQHNSRIIFLKCAYSLILPFTRRPVMRFSGPRRFDIVIFTTDGMEQVDKKYAGKDFIKRVVGLPGEEIEIANGRIFVDEELLIRPDDLKGIVYTDARIPRYNYTHVTVPEDCCFVLGDNSAVSEDSRVWGFVPHANIKGRAILLYSPLKLARFL